MFYFNFTTTLEKQKVHLSVSYSASNLSDLFLGIKEAVSNKSDQFLFSFLTTLMLLKIFNDLKKYRHKLYQKKTGLQADCIQPR